MKKNNHNLSTKRTDRWSESFAEEYHTNNVSVDEGLYYDVENHFPSYVFVEKYFRLRDEEPMLTIFGEEFQGGITFFTRADEPLYVDENTLQGFRWFPIERRHYRIISRYLHDNQPILERRYGVEGWIIPLIEVEHFSSWQDVNAYLHNLMFWESMITPAEAGPIMERISWLTNKVYDYRMNEYYMSKDLCDAGLIKDFYPTQSLINNLIKALKTLESERKSHKDEIDKLRSYYEKEMDKLRNMEGEEKSKLMDRARTLAELAAKLQMNEEAGREMAKRTDMMQQQISQMMETFLNEQQKIAFGQDMRRSELLKLLEELNYHLREDGKN